MVKWGSLGVALLLGAALVGSAVVSYRDARFVSGAVSERQGAGLLRRVRQELGDGDLPSVEALARTLDSHEGLGLTYLAVVEAGRVAAEAGQARLSGQFPGPGQSIGAQGRVRMAVPLFRGSRRRPGDQGVDRAARYGGASDRGPPGLMVLIEFEPLASAELARRALVGVWLASGAAVLLTGSALVLWRLGRKALRMEAELEAQRHLAALGGMSAVLAHEIRNPLAALKGHAQLLAEGPGDERTLARVKRVVDEAVRLETLTNDLLAFAKSGAVTRVPASPAAVVQAAVAATNPDRIDVDTGGAQATYLLDPGRMEEVLINLIENALHVTPAGAKVTVRGLAAGARLRFQIRDHGPGVPPSERVQIFEPFHTSKTHGTGLGLAVVRRIVDLHGGTVTVTDGPDGGAVFQVEI